MEVTRTSLRAQRKQQIPKQVTQGQTQQKGGYGEELKQQLQNIGDVRREAPVIQAKRVDPIISPTEQYTQDAVKTAMEKLKKFVLSQGLGGDDSGATEQTTPFAGGGGGNKGFFSGDNLGNLSYKNMPFVPQDQYKGVETDNLRYGDTMPEGAFGIGSKATDDFSDNPEYRSTVGDFAREQEKIRLAKVMSSLPSDYKQTEQRAFDDAEAYRRLVASGLDKTVSGEDAKVNVGSGRLGSFGLGTAGEGAPSGDDLKPGSFPISTIKREDQAERMGGQGGLALGTTTQRQGGTVKDGIKVAKKESPAVNASSFLQKNLRGGRKDESARPAQVKQTVASLPSNYKQTEAKAFAQAKSFQDSKAKGQAATKATGIPSGSNLKAGSFGISAAGKKQAEANKAEKKAAPKVSVNTPAKAVKVATKVKDKSDKRGTGFASKPSAPKAAPKKPTPAQKTAVKKSTTVKKSTPNTSKSRRRGSSGTKSSSSKKSSSKKSGGSKSGGSKSGGSKSAGSKKASRGAKGGSSSRSRGGTSKGTSRRTNRRRSRRRCDIRCKFDISILTNLNLIKDDLADVAYFVKDLQEIN